jgi:hypothetical protein
MAEMMKKTGKYGGRGLLLAISLVMALGLGHSQAYAWGSATHAYIADKLGATQGTANLNEIYGAMGLDTFNYMFGSPFQSQLHDLAHHKSEKVWNAAQDGDAATRSVAYGFMSHNDDWGADYTAHHGGRSYGLTDGYVIAKTNEMVQTSFVQALGLPLPVATEVTHIMVETGVDVLVQRLDEEIGSKIVQSTEARTDQFPGLLVQAYAADLNLGYQDAAYLIIGTEQYFRAMMHVYGLALTQNESTAITLLAGQFADLASAYLGAYGIPLDVTPELVTAFITNAMDLCKDDFDGEIALTIGYVDGQLKDHGVSAVPTPATLMLLGPALLGMVLAGGRKIKGRQ